MGKKEFEIERNEGVDEINLRSEEVQEIMGRIPSWIERWGILAIAFMLVIILAGAAFFPYPDTLTGTFIYSPENTSSGTRSECFALLPAYGIGKAHKGQTVKVRLENYPDNEFGYLSGIVTDVSKIADNNGFYRVDIVFPKSFLTSKGESLSTDMQLKGMAEIEVRNIRMIKHFDFWNLSVQ